MSRIIIVLTSAVLLTVASLVAFRVELFEFGISAALENAGLGPVSFKVEEMGRTQTIIGPVSIANDTVKFERLVAVYELLPALFDNQLASVEIVDLQLHASWTERGLSFGAMDDLFFQSAEEIDEASESGPADQASSPIGKINVQNARLNIEGLAIPLEARLDVALDATSTSIPVQVSGGLNGPGVSGQLKWEGIIEPDKPLSSKGSGSLIVDIAGLKLPGATREVSVNAEISAALSESGLEITLGKALEIDAPWPAALSLADQNPEADPNFSLMIGSDISEAHLLSVVKTAEGYRGQTDIQAEWQSPFGTGSADVAGWFTLGQDNLPQDFKFDRLNLFVQDLPSSLGTVSAQISADGLKGPLAVAEGPVQFSGRVSEGALGEIEYAGGEADGSATFRLDGLSLAFAMDTLSLALEGVRGSDALHFSDAIRASLEQNLPASQTLTTVFGADGSATITFDLGLSFQENEISLLNGTETATVFGHFPALIAEGFWITNDNELDARLVVSGGKLNSEYGQLTAINIDALGTLNELVGTVKGRLNLDPNKNSSAEGSPLTANFELIDGDLSLKGGIALGRNQELGNFDLSYTIAEQNGFLAANVGPLTFGGTNISPSDIRPLGLNFIPLSGEFFANLELPIGDHLAKQTGTVFAKDVEIETGEFRFDRINTAAEFKQVWPPEMLPNQQLAIGLIQAGVPLSDIVATYSLRSLESFALSELSMNLAGGNLFAEAAELDLTSDENRIVFQVEGVQLEDLASLSGLGGLTAKGRMSGSIPVRFIEGDAIVENGSLTTQEAGFISYKPADATSAIAQDDGGLGLALQALEDFQYDSLTIGISGSLSEELEATLQINGRNPALYDGYPIEFNLNLSGELANVIRGSLTGYRVPETIKRQLMAFPPSQ